jgi:hypothetical protein
MPNRATEEETSSAHLDLTRIQQLAKQAQVPVERVKQMYRQEIDALSKSATILSYVGVIADRRVRLRLRSDH